MENNKFLTIADDIACGIAQFIYDGKFKLSYANQGFFDLMGYTCAEYNVLFEDTCGMSIEKGELLKIQAIMQDQLCTSDRLQMEYQHIMPDKTSKWIAVDAKRSINENGQVIFRGIFIDITDCKKRQQVVELETEPLKEQSKLDSFTGVYNKRAVAEVVDRYLQTSRQDTKHALMLIKIDNLKQINEEIGHLFGDAVLLDISTELKNEFMATEIIGRVGGDNFVILFKNIQSISHVEEKVNAVYNIFRHVYSGENKAQHVFSNLGIALFPEHGHDYQTLFQNADKALYEIKNTKKASCKIYNKKIEQVPYCNQHSQHSLHSYVSKVEYSNQLINYNKKNYMLGLINIFEILFESKDIRSGINMVLRMLGKHFNVSRVYIFENDRLNADINITYEWCNKGIESRIKKHEQFRYYGVAKDRLFCIEDLSNQEVVQATPATRVLKTYWDACDIKAILQYGFCENGDFKGTIGFDECRAPRKWTQEEIDSLMIVAKFIASYLVKMRAQEEIEKLAYIDTLTGMWNLNKFKLNAMKIVNEVNHNGTNLYAMVCLDIKKLRYINDMFGFEVGDEILKYIANQLKKTLDSDVMFTRTEADKFFILTKYKNKKTLIEWLEALHNKIQYYNSTKTGCYKLVFSCGIYLLKADGSSINVIIDKADIARRSARSGHNTSFVFYNDNFLQVLLREKELEDMADDALMHKEFITYYQPKIELATGKIKGAEALVRWISPSKGFMSPADFLPVFEKNGFIAKMDFYVFELVYASLRKWLDAGREVVPISINLSRVYLTDRMFIDKLVELSKQYNVPTKYIELELTESVFTENTANIIELMKNLCNLGFSISIDDFGSGYSSLKLLRDLPVDYLKLDKAFLDNGAENDREKIIIEYVIQMAKRLGIKVVSEGVETANQAEFLAKCSCDLAQGYLFAKPMPIADFEKLMWEQKLS
ncbi:MAG: MorA [Firmicutes bacterium]|nr:MorA [Bacillota bacterium]